MRKDLARPFLLHHDGTSITDIHALPGLYAIADDNIAFTSRCGWDDPTELLKATRQKALHLLKDYVAHIPRWTLKGYAPAEL
jgi:hypothetical protein